MNIIGILKQYCRLPPALLGSNLIPTILLVIACISIGISVAVLTNFLFSLTESSSSKIFYKIKKSVQISQSKPPSTLTEALGLKNSKSNQLQHKIYEKFDWFLPRKLFHNALYLITSSLLSLILFDFCVVVLQNIAAGILAILASFLLLSQVFNKSAQRKILKYNEQLPSAIRIITAVLSDTGNLTLALENAAQRSPEPVKSLFQRVIEKLNNGESKQKAFAVIKTEIGTGHAVMLTTMLDEAYQQGLAAAPMFNTLASQFDTTHRLELSNKVLLAPSRVYSILIQFGVIVMVYLSTKLVPNANQYITDNIGKSLVLLCFISLIVAIIADRFWSKVEG